ncbi:thioesterase family protein [uncultured Abyssibacter sp.]|uniref:acyl-CoA thioesterase n=1 Tax=uncultured Abyssibacter sp. TaxID=2320202 RepID=UPI0032B11DC3
MSTADDYPHQLKIPTRWKDNDVYGHVNNVEYYSYFDTVINDYLIRRGGLDIHAGPVIGLAIETGCKFHRSLAFPEMVSACLRVDHLGNSSVRYGIGLFGETSPGPAAEGHFVHVFVDRDTRRPVPIPDALRQALQALEMTS